MRRISAYEFRQWYVYEQCFGPLGGERIDHAAALIAERITNMLRDPSAKPISQDVFLARWNELKEATSEDGDYS